MDSTCDTSTPSFWQPQRVRTVRTGVTGHQHPVPENRSLMGYLLFKIQRLDLVGCPPTAVKTNTADKTPNQPQKPCAQNFTKIDEEAKARAAAPRIHTHTVLVRAIASSASQETPSLFFNPSYSDRLPFSPSFVASTSTSFYTLNVLVVSVDGVGGCVGAAVARLAVIVIPHVLKVLIDSLRRPALSGNADDLRGNSCGDYLGRQILQYHRPGCHLR